MSFRKNYNDVICFDCGAKDKYKLIDATRTYSGRGYEFDISIKEAYCSKCGALITIEDLEEEIRKIANKKIREAKGIISQKNVDMIIRKYDVSLEFLSKILDIKTEFLQKYLEGYTPNEENSKKLKQCLFPEMLKDILDTCDEDLKETLDYKKMKKFVDKEIKNTI